MNLLINRWVRRKTRNLTQIPLFAMIFNYRRYEDGGKQGSCEFWAHPEIDKDEYVREELQKVVDYIRDNYNLEIFTKI